MIRSSGRRRRGRPSGRTGWVLPGLLVVVTALVAGCSTGGAAGGPELGAGVAAVVGSRSVSSDLLEQRVRTAAPDLAQAIAAQAAQQGRTDPGLDASTLADQSRELLTTAVLHEVIAEAARRENIVVPPAQVDAQLAAAGGAQAAAGTGYDLATLRELVGDQIAVAEIGRREFDRLQVTVDIGTFGNRASAQAAAAQLAVDPGTGVLAGLPADSRVTDATLRPGTATPGSRVRTSSSLVFGLPNRTVSLSTSQQQTQLGATAPDPSTQPWTVVRVRDRSLSAPPPGGDTVPAALVDATSMIQFGLRSIQPLAVELGVRVNPRYGTWDPTQERVVAPPGAAGTITPLTVAVPFSPPLRAPVPAALPSSEHFSPANSSFHW